MRTLGRLLVIIFVAFTLYSAQDDILPFLRKATESLQNDISVLVSSFPASSSSQKEEVLTPGPLLEFKDILKGNDASVLTSAGVVSATNAARNSHGLPPLRQSRELAASAEMKVNDMFARQYFEHDSPDGKGVSDLADEAGYAYIIIGENLALGDFASDQAVVQAWMDSPGHRANILHETYEEIGVAVGHGIYQGSMTWMAVQHFGKPASSCPPVSESLKKQISTYQAEIQSMEAELDMYMAKMEASSGPEREEYRQKYNAGVEKYNGLVAKAKQAIATYNGQVRSFNECAGV